MLYPCEQHAGGFEIMVIGTGIHFPGKITNELFDLGDIAWLIKRTFTGFCKFTRSKPKNLSEAFPILYHCYRNIKVSNQLKDPSAPAYYVVG